MQSAVVISCLSQMVKETLEAIVLYLCKEVSERASCVVISHYIILVCFNFLFNIHKGSSQSHLLVMGTKRERRGCAVSLLSSSKRSPMPFRNKPGIFHSRLTLFCSSTLTRSILLLLTTGSQKQCSHILDQRPHAGSSLEINCSSFAELFIKHFHISSTNGTFSGRGV